MKKCTTKTCLILSWIFIVFLLVGCANEKAESEFKKNNMVGTWICRAHGGYAEITYYDNGFSEGKGRLQMAGGPISFEYKATWSIEGEYMVEIIKESNIPKFLKPGETIKDRITSFLEDEIVLMSSDGYVHSHHRKK